MNDVRPVETKKPLIGPTGKAVMGFAAGILLYEYFNPVIPLLFGAVIASILLLIAFYGKRQTGNALACTVLVLAGMFASAVQHRIDRPYVPPDSMVNRHVVAEGMVSGAAGVSDGSVSFTLHVRRILYGGTAFPAEGLLRCTVYDKPFVPFEGAHIAVPGHIRKYPQPVDRKGFVSGLSTGPPVYRLTAGAYTDDPVVLVAGGAIFGHARRYVSGLIDRYPYGGHRDLLRAMTIGDRRGLADEAGDAFARAGIAHILAVSGLHAGILLSVIGIILGLFPISRNVRIIIILTVLFLYAGLCGFRPPVVRTFIMISMVMAGRLFERSRNNENTLFAAVMIILACDPRSLFGPSLQLSSAAVWAIIVFYPPVIAPARKWITSHTSNRHIRYSTLSIISVIIVSAIAFAATAPVVAVHFGTLPLLSIPVNVPAVMLAGLIVTFGFFSLVFTALGVVFAPVAAALSSVTGAFLRMLSALASFVAGIPFASIDTGRIAPFAALCILAWFFVLSRSRGRTGFQKALIYIPLVGMLFVSWSTVFSPQESAERRGAVCFFDVGQGDSALLEYGTGRYFLVDTGISSSARYAVVPSLRNMGVRSLDGVFISHLDTDHVGGLDTVLEAVPVGRIFCRGSVRDSLAAIYGANVVGLAAGDSISFDGGGIAVLAPFAADESLRDYGLTGENGKSLVLRFSMCGSDILFPGDIEERMQRCMTAWGPSVQSSVLKLPHHGAEPLDESFLGAVDPDIAVVSCGLNNRYGHPAISTVELLDERSITTLRTDRDGTVTVEFPQGDIVTYWTTPD